MLRKSWAAAACVAAALSLAGCGGTTTGTPSADPSAAASSTTFTTIDELGPAIGAAMAEKKTANFTFNFGGGGEAITGDGAYRLDGANTAMKMAMPIPGQGETQFIVIGTDIYIQLPGNPSGKPWIKATADPNDPIGSQFAGLTEQLDPSSQFTQLSTGGELTGSAPETVNGVETTRYTIKVDANKIAAAATGEQKKQAEELVKAGVSTFDMQVWVDGDNLPAKVGSSFPVQGQTASIEMSYTGWGQPVDIRAPSPDQVGSLGG